MQGEDLDESYREVLDGVIDLHIELYDDRPYDMVGRRIAFSEDYRPVDVVVADFESGDVRLKYIDAQDGESEKRREARDAFAEILGESEWSPLPSATRRSSNSEQIYDSKVVGNIYAPEALDSADEFLRRFTGSDSSNFDEIEVLEG